MPDIIFGNFKALRQQMLDIGAHILHHARPEKANAAFKMEIKAAVIHIGCADDRDCIIGHIQKDCVV